MIDALHMADIIFPTSEPFARLRTLGLYSSQLCALGLSCQAHSKSAETRALDVWPELKMALNFDAIPSRIAGPSYIDSLSFGQLLRGAIRVTGCILISALNSCLAGRTLAATRSSLSGWIRPEKIVESRKHRMSPWHLATPALTAEAWPPFSLKIGIIRSPYREMISRELSVDPSSTTMISFLG